VRLLYSALFYALIPFILGRLTWRGRKLPSYRERWRERFALYYDLPPESNLVWFHAVSVGEAEAAFPIIRSFRARFPAFRLLVTCTTPTGSARIQAVLGDSVQHVYLPYDLPDCVARFLNHFRPALGVVMETEIWPNLYQQCKARGIPLTIVNGRLSEKSARGYRRLRGLTAESLSSLALVAAQTAADAKRYRSLGADPAKVRVAGNVKFDLEFSEALREEALRLRAALFGGRPVWIAGSTHPGEEDQILAAQAHISAALPETLLVLAPRHPERAGEIAGLCTKRGLMARRRTENLPCDHATAVFLLDSLGELRLFYGASDVAFVGGSLVPRGGHNLLEPAAAGVPVFYGPRTFNFAEIARRLGQSGGGLEVHDAAELAEQVIRLLQDPGKRLDIGSKGRAFVDANRGAVERVTNLLGALLDPLELSKSL
jgi:3-deoxy-D-manno-octulosonic-acid transferase